MVACSEERMNGKKQNKRAAAGAKERLLDAGLQIFGLHGFDGVRTRTLSDAAGVNQSAIPYYFGGKKGLYLEVARQLADNLNRRLRGALDALPEDIDSMERSEAIDMLRAVMSGFATNVVGDEATAVQSSFLAREQLQPTEAFEVLYTRFFEPLHTTISSLVARLRGTEHDNPDTILTAHALIGQVLGFAVAKQTFLRRSGLAELGPKEVEAIARTVAEMTVQAVG